MGQLSAATNRLVLLADDNDETAFVIEAMLDLMEFGVERARDGREALEMSGASAYSLILMDIEMPVMDGLAATKAIRDQESDGLVPPVPIVGITGHSDAGTRRLCQLAGMDDVLCKPFLMEQLEATLKELCAKRVN
jgi:CheY-like chemotaxis protein